MPLYLAVDAGGTKTQCLLADASRVLACASTGTVKLMRVSEAEADARLRAMLDEVASAAGVSLANITHTCFGLAGLSSPTVRAWATRTVSGLAGGSLLLCGDEEIALDAAFAGGSGILVIAGTGSNAIGRAPGGSLYGAGGWGPVLGDEGSGYWIGLEALRVALREQDQAQAGAPAQANRGADPTSVLLREVQAHWNLASLGDLVALANLGAPSETSAPPDFAALAPIIARCAAQGDALAAHILQRAGEELAAVVGLVARKMCLEPAPTSPTSRLELLALNLDVAFTGSVLAHITPVRDAMTCQLRVTLPAARVLMPFSPLGQLAAHPPSRHPASPTPCATRLHAPRRYRYGPNGIIHTRSLPCAARSQPTSPAPCPDAPVASVDSYNTVALYSI